MRRGKEFYVKNYKKVMELHESGLSAKEISKRLGISYSAVYNWITQRRKPSKDKLTELLMFLNENGPTPLIELRKTFPKHSELFLTAEQRGLEIRRYKLPKIFGEYSMWYFLNGQEDELKERINKIIKRREELKKEFIRALNNYKY
ncbi:MAG: helix-turn-helix transcriptional regulator [Candidatus Aenigmatarchaeota archaeon]